LNPDSAILAAGLLSAAREFKAIIKTDCDLSKILCEKWTQLKACSRCSWQILQHTLIKGSALLRILQVAFCGKKLAYY